MYKVKTFGTDMKVFQVHKELDSVITSYSIHYTKLYDEAETDSFHGPFHEEQQTTQIEERR